MFYLRRKLPMRSVVGWLGIIFLFGLLVYSVAMADEAIDRRVQISLPIFPRIVAVDDDFKNKLLPKDKVLLVFLYETNKDNAVKLVDSLRGKISNVAGLDFVAQAVSVRDQLNAQAPTALFITERLSRKSFVPMLGYSVNHKRILFSPFAGDVERGATAGVFITSRVQPYFNVKTLERAEIKINPVLLKLSKLYE